MNQRYVLSLCTLFSFCISLCMEHFPSLSDILKTTHPGYIEPFRMSPFLPRLSDCVVPGIGESVCIAKQAVMAEACTSNRTYIMRLAEQSIAAEALARQQTIAAPVSTSLAATAKQVIQHGALPPAIQVKQPAPQSPVDTYPEWLKRY